MERRVGPGHPRMYLFPLLFPWCASIFFRGREWRFFPLSFLTGGLGPARPVWCHGKVICKTATTDCFGSGGAAAMALRAAYSGIEIRDYTHICRQPLRPGRVPWGGAPSGLRCGTLLGRFRVRLVELGGGKAGARRCDCRGVVLLVVVPMVQAICDKHISGIYVNVECERGM